MSNWTTESSHQVVHTRRFSGGFNPFLQEDPEGEDPLGFWCMRKSGEGTGMSSETLRTNEETSHATQVPSSTTSTGSLPLVMRTKKGVAKDKEKELLSLRHMSD